MVLFSSHSVCVPAIRILQITIFQILIPCYFVLLHTHFFWNLSDPTGVFPDVTFPTFTRGVAPVGGGHSRRALPEIHWVPLSLGQVPSGSWVELLRASREPRRIHTCALEPVGFFDGGIEPIGPPGGSPEGRVPAPVRPSQVNATRGDSRTGRRRRSTGPPPRPPARLFPLPHAGHGV